MTLIDDEEEEEEDDESEEEDDEDDSQILANSEDVEQQNYTFTLDGQTLSSLSGSGDQVVVFEVVQMGSQDGNDTNEAQIFDATAIETSTPVRKPRRKTNRSALLHTNGAVSGGMITHSSWVLVANFLYL